MAKSKTTHSTCYDLAASKYKAGKWSAKALAALVAASKLTQTEYDEIVSTE